MRYRDDAGILEYEDDDNHDHDHDYGRGEGMRAYGIAAALAVIAGCSFNSKETVYIYMDADGGDAVADAGPDAGGGADAGAGDAGPVDAGPIDAGTRCEEIAAGEDPRNFCTPSAQSSCGTTGACDGTGECAFYPATTVAVYATCVNVNTRQDPTYCLGDGGIGQTPSTVSCGLSVCDAGTCGWTCADDMGCVTGAYCDAGGCEPTRDAGSACSVANSCGTGICAQSVCCKTACGDAGRWCEGCEVGTGDCRARAVAGWEKRVSTLGGATTKPSLVAVDGGYAYAAVSGGTSIVFLRMDGDGGAVGVETVIVDGGFASGATRGPVMVAGGSASGMEMYYVGWWSTTMNSVYVTSVWVEVDGGGFGTAENRYDDGGFPSVDAWVGYGGDAGVMLVWADDELSGGTDIFYRIRDVSGAGMGEAGNLSDGNLEIQNTPVVVWGWDRWGVAWQDTSVSPAQLVFVEVGLDGGVVAGPLGIAGGAGAKSDPRLAYDAERGEYVVVYVEGGNIYLQRVRDGGIEGSRVFVSQSVNTASEPTVAVGRGEIGVAWKDTKVGSGGEIYFRRVDWDGGMRGEEVRVSNLNDAGGDDWASETPSLVWNGDGYSAAWSDYREAPSAQSIYMTALWCAP